MTRFMGCVFGSGFLRALYLKIPGCRNTPMQAPHVNCTDSFLSFGIQFGTVIVAPMQGTRNRSMNSCVACQSALLLLRS